MHIIQTASNCKIGNQLCKPNKKKPSHHQKWMVETLHIIPYAWFYHILSHPTQIIKCSQYV